MTGTPEWMSGAACRGSDVDFYPFANDRPKIAEAEAVCVDCPVVDICAEAGRNEPYGVWGGVFREKLRPTPRRPEARHGTRWRYESPAYRCRCEDCRASQVSKKRRAG